MLKAYLHFTLGWSTFGSILHTRSGNVNVYHKTLWYASPQFEGSAAHVPLQRKSVVFVSMGPDRDRDSEACVGVAVTERDKERESANCEPSFERDPRRREQDPRCHASQYPLATAITVCRCPICLAKPTSSLHNSQKAIREEIGDAKFCIMADEARDESMKEQMAVVFRYVDAEGFVKERFFWLIHVVDTTALTLKKGIYSLLSQHCLDIQNIQWQGYDGASNMREKRWSSQFKSVSSLLRMFSSTVEVLQNIIDDAIDGENQAEGESAYDGLTSFEFVFILHLEKEIMEITDKLCQALQSQYQDILNHCIDVLDMNARYVARRGRARNQQDNLTNEHNYQVNIFYATIDSQLQELNYRFTEDAMKLLRLSSALEPREVLKSYRISDLCLLVKNFYPQDFTDYDKQVLEKEFYHFENNVVQDPKFKKLKSLSELSQWLVRTGNLEYYRLVYRMVRLMLTLLVSTATTERAFSAMKLVKTKL
uniref:Uncharacterized protein n=1 Tax=Quercus lobata TaxID=97700 RepID=A0A7N2LSC1_QUELO